MTVITRTPDGPTAFGGGLFTSHGASFLLAGMAFGALCRLPLADRIGRRKLTLAGLAVAPVSMLAASVARTVWLATRVVTGSAVGVMAACLRDRASLRRSVRWTGARTTSVCS